MVQILVPMAAIVGVAGRWVVSRVRWRRHAVLSRVQWLHFHIIRVRRCIFYSPCRRVVPTRHFRERVFVDVRCAAARRAAGRRGIEARNLRSLVYRWRGGRAIEAARRRWRRLVVGPVVRVFCSLWTVSRGRTATGQAPTATFAALNAAAHAVDHTGNDRKDDERADDDSNDDGPSDRVRRAIRERGAAYLLAVGLRHARVPAREGLGGLFDVVDHAARPQGYAGDRAHD